MCHFRECHMRFDSPRLRGPVALTPLRPLSYAASCWNRIKAVAGIEFPCRAVCRIRSGRVRAARRLFPNFPAQEIPHELRRTSFSSCRSPERPAAAHSPRRRARRGNHGLAHRRPPCQCGHPVPSARSRRRKISERGARAARPRRAGQIQARGLFRALAAPRSSRPAPSKTTCPRLAECDWVIEAVAENLEIKTALLDTRRAAPRATHALLTTNTSGLPIAHIAAAIARRHVQQALLRHALFQSAALHAACWSHPHAEADPALRGRLCRLCRPHARQAGRLRQRHAQLHRQPHRRRRHVHRRQSDAGAGASPSKRSTRSPARPSAGRAPEPSASPIWSASTFWPTWPRNFPEGVDCAASFAAVLDEIVKRGWLGDKAGQGFYKKTRGADGKEERLVLDPATFEYRPSPKPALPRSTWRKTPPRSASASSCCSANDPAKDKGRGVPVAASRARFGTSPPIASAKSPTTRPPSTPPCAPASTGRWAPLKCGMRPACPRSVERMKAFGIPVSATSRRCSPPGTRPGIADEAALLQARPPRQMEPVATVPGHARVADFRRDA